MISLYAFDDNGNSTRNTTRHQSTEKEEFVGVSDTGIDHLTPTQVNIREYLQKSPAVFRTETFFGSESLIVPGAR